MNSDPSTHKSKATAFLESLLDASKQSTNKTEQAWTDPDDESVKGSLVYDEPEWAKKRRQLTANEPKIQIPNKITKFIPKTSETRYKIDRIPGCKKSIILSDGVKHLRFDSKGKMLAILGFKGQKCLLYSVEVKGKLKFSLNPKFRNLSIEGNLINDFAFKGDGKGLFMIGKGRSLFDYDFEKGVATRISSLLAPNKDMVYSKVFTSSDEQVQLYAVSCNDGGLLVCDSVRNQVICHLHHNAECMGVAFHPSMQRLISSDREGNLYEWDLVNGKCVKKLKDDSALKISSFCSNFQTNPLNSGKCYMAVGSQTGYLNIYPITGMESSGCLQNEFFKSFGNLTTEVSSIAMDEGGKFVVYSTPHQRNGVRIIDVGSNSVVSNWPTNESILGRVTSVAICSHNKVIAVGNRGGKVKFFSIMC